MPLANGSSNKVISENIEELEKAGHKPSQAAAIAYKKAGKDTESDEIYDYPNKTTQKTPMIAIKDETTEAWISKKIEELIKRGYKPDVAKAVAYAEHKRNARDDDTGRTFKIYSSDSASAKEYDLNGWPEIKGNPISKVGVFPYSGQQISADLEPDKMYQVYRSEEELSHPETVESFKLLPWTDEHAMLGAEGEGMLPAERKGIHGVIGENVYYEDGYLKGNIKIFSEKLAKLIQEGKKELSIGYRCLYDMTPGVYNGIKYDAVQRNIRGNHLALVGEGRSGPDVAVLDHFKLVLDAKELKMPDMKREEKRESVDEGEAMTLEEVLKACKHLHARVKELMKKDDPNAESEVKAEHSKKASEKGDAKDAEGQYKKFVNKAAVEDTEEEREHERYEEIEDTTEEEELSQDKEEDEEGEKKGDMHKPADKKAKDRKGKDKKEGMDAKAIFLEISRRDDLANRLSAHVGTFDHSEKTHNEVAKYGVSKLGLKCNPGHEVPMLEGYLSAAKANMVVTAHAQDSRGQSSCIDAYLKGSN